MIQAKVYVTYLSTVCSKLLPKLKTENPLIFLNDYISRSATRLSPHEDRPKDRNSQFNLASTCWHVSLAM